MENENAPEWQAPPPPEKIVQDPPQMSELATLFNIFLEPGRTFEDLKRKPRFIIGALLIALAGSQEARTRKAAKLAGALQPCPAPERKHRLSPRRLARAER